LVETPLSPGKRPPSWRNALIVAGAALLLTGLNSLKPLHIDDAAYYTYAAHIAEHPLSPYGFELLWYDEVASANEILAPPFFLYAWAAAQRLAGDNPVLWKWSLVPFQLLFTGSIWLLARRFARGLETPLVLLVTLSPAVLPSVNFMLDLPALALSLAALAILLHACDCGSGWWAVLAGAVAALAMQTKYSALVTPAVLLAGSYLHRRARYGLLSAAIALALFASWELFVLGQHGASHFLVHSTRQDGRLLQRAFSLLQPLLTMAGGLAPAVTLLGLVALRTSRCLLAGAASYMILGFALIAITPDLAVLESASRKLLSLHQVIFGGFGLAFAIVLARVIRAVLVSSDSPAGRSHEPIRKGVFLVFWLALEVSGYLVLTPFPAARRVLGILVISTLLAGRLAARTCREQAARRLVHAVVAAGMVLGIGFHLVDWHDARAVERLVHEASQELHAADGTVWYSGVWGMKFYAERAGMAPLLPGRSRLRPGDWLVLADEPIPRPKFDPQAAPLQRITQLSIQDRLPLRMFRSFYSGRVPIEHWAGPRCSLTIYQVTDDFIARAP
jgi:hypothetical protein